jgi:hypothetical protein
VLLCDVEVLAEDEDDSPAAQVLAKEVADLFRCGGGGGAGGGAWRGVGPSGMGLAAAGTGPGRWAL